MTDVVAKPHQDGAVPRSHFHQVNTSLVLPPPHPSRPSSQPTGVMSTIATRQGSSINGRHAEPGRPGTVPAPLSLLPPVREGPLQTGGPAAARPQPDTPRPNGTSQQHPQARKRTVADIDIGEANRGQSSSKKTRPPLPEIDSDGANSEPRIQDLSIYTPRNGNPFGPEAHRELICLCTKAPKVPRPRNAFILYRQHHQAQVAAQHPGLPNPEISKLIGTQWNEQPAEVKAEWKNLAEEEKQRHQRQYPDYRYQPKRGGKNGAHSNKPASADGEDPGRCAKCGGRYIATPRTPSSPYATPLPSAFPSSSTAAGHNMSSYGLPNHSRMASEGAGDYHGGGRNGSNASTMQFEHERQRRMAQAQIRELDEYQILSPDFKRRRFNPVHSDGQMVPGSPPEGYMHLGHHGAGAEPRYQQHQQQRQSVNGPPMSSAAYGHGPLARLGPGPGPNMQYRQGSIGGMQPPRAPPPPPHPLPRASVSYQPVPTTAGRPGAGFDESLRLPPLQTHLPQSPHMKADGGQTVSAVASQAQAVTGLGIMNGSAQAPRQSWDFMSRLEILRAIASPLKAPGPGQPAYETRGPIIAIEGFSPRVLREVTAVVERALSISGECVVKIWQGNQARADKDRTATPRADGRVDDGSDGADDDRRKKAAEPVPTQPSPIAGYVVKMVDWHRTSAELIRFVTTRPSARTPTPAASPRDNDSDVVMSTGSSSPTSGAGSGAGAAAKLPVAVIGDGYSMTLCERHAAALPITDAYRPEDHWRWVATLWRGIVGADLTLYVKRSTEEETRGNSCVELVAPHVMLLRVTDDRGVDEKLERRLGFEIMEWVRAGTFDDSARAGAGAGAGAGPGLRR